MEQFTQTEHFNCSPGQLYNAIMNAKTHSASTGGPVEMDNTAGGTFDHSALVG